MMELIAGLKEYQLGTLPGWSLVGIALMFWWKGLPGLIDAWEKRSAGIESRLQAAMTVTLDRYELELARFSERLTESDNKHRDCEERSMKQTERINILEKEIIGLHRQIASQDIAKAGHLNLDATPATKAAVARMKVAK